MILLLSEERSRGEKKHSKVVTTEITSIKMDTRELPLESKKIVHGGRERRRWVVTQGFGEILKIPKTKKTKIHEKMSKWGEELGF